MTQLAQLEGIVRNVLDEQFGGVVFDVIRVREGLDHDGDAVLYVKVVFRSDEPLDVNARVGFVRHLRPHLRRLGEDRFPIMSFVSSEDLAEHGVCAVSTTSLTGQRESGPAETDSKALPE